MAPCGLNKFACCHIDEHPCKYLVTKTFFLDFICNRSKPASPLQRFAAAVYPSDEEGDADSTNLGVTSSEEENDDETDNRDVPGESQANNEADSDGIEPIHTPKKRKKRQPLQDCVVLEQELEDKAVDMIESHPCLWFISDKNYKNKQTKQTIWGEIAKVCGLTVEQMQTWWESQRDRYVREKRERESKPTGSGADDYVSSAKSIWLARRLAFYGKVCRHHRKSLKSIKAAKARRENRDPDPEQLEIDTNQDVDSVAVDSTQSTRGKTPKKGGGSSDILGEISDHLRSVARAREDLMRKKTTQEAYGDLVCTWIYNMSTAQFEQVQDDFNVYMLQSNKRFPKVTSMGPPRPVVTSTTAPNIVILDDSGSTGYVSRSSSATTPSTVTSGSCYNTDMTPCEDPDPNPGWQPEPEHWPNKAFNPNYPLFQSQTKSYVDKVMARQVRNVPYSDSGIASFSNTTNNNLAYIGQGTMQAGYTGNQIQKYLGNNQYQPAAAATASSTSFGQGMDMMRSGMMAANNTQYGNVTSAVGQAQLYDEKYSLTELQNRPDVRGIKKATKTKSATPMKTRPKTPEPVQSVVMQDVSLANTGLYVSTGLNATNAEPTCIPETQPQQVHATDETESVHVNTAFSADEEE